MGAVTVTSLFRTCKELSKNFNLGNIKTSAQNLTKYINGTTNGQKVIVIGDVSSYSWGFSSGKY